MGCSNSKGEKNEALLLCKARKRFIKQAIDSRYALSAAHLSYTQSLHNVGVALRRFAVAEVLVESSLSTSATDKTPSHSSYPSPSPSHYAEMVDSPMRKETPSPPPPLSTISYMRSEGPTAVTVRMNFPLDHFVDDDTLTIPIQPPPPPPHLEEDFSWDFFGPIDAAENAYKQNFDNLMNLKQFRENGHGHFAEEETNKWQRADLENKVEVCDKPPIAQVRNDSSNGVSSDGVSELGKAGVRMGNSRESDCLVNKPVESLTGPASSEQCSSKWKEKNGPNNEICAQREDPSEFITHRAKDFLSSMKDIEHRFFRASESGKEVSRMLEGNKVQQRSHEPKGRSPGSLFLAVCHLACCTGEPAHPLEAPQNVTKVITWNRSTSSRSSSSRNPLTSTTRDDADDSGSDFIEEFCMISGSHSSTLDRLFAWERKLFDEVKASESIQREYNRKCNLLRHQFAKDLKPLLIDNTRAAVKDLHSQLQVAIHAVDSISKRIEKLRDDELQPQLVELIQGLMRMWKSMLECHHAQYITISLAYHARSSRSAIKGESNHEVLLQLQHEIAYFYSSFSDWFEALKKYAEALNSWLQNCIIHPQERSRRRAPFSPRRALAPPIFVLCRDWLAAIQALPYKELSEAIKGLIPELNGLQVEAQNKEKLKDLETSGEPGSREEVEKGDKVFNLNSFQSSLTRAFDWLTKFAEESVKMYEGVRQETEAARTAYANCRLR